MTTKDALWRRILAAPADDTDRLVFADLVEDDDPALAEFVRLGCRLHRLDLEDLDYETFGDHDNPDVNWAAVDRDEEIAAARGRVVALLAAHGEDWTGEGGEPFPDSLLGQVWWTTPGPAGWQYHFDRGFVGGLHLPADDFFLFADDLTAAHPVTRVSFPARPLTTVEYTEDPNGMRTEVSFAHRPARVPGRVTAFRTGQDPPRFHLHFPDDADLHRLLAAEWPRIEFTFPSTPPPVPGRFGPTEGEFDDRRGATLPPHLGRSAWTPQAPAGPFPGRPVPVRGTVRRIPLSAATGVTVSCFNREQV